MLSLQRATSEGGHAPLRQARFFFSREIQLTIVDPHDHVNDTGSRGGTARHEREPDGPVRGGLPDEYQDGLTAGSLVKARRCWKDLRAAGRLPLPQRFAFLFHCPSDQLASGLRDFLRYTDYAGYVRTLDRSEHAAADSWHVVGSTHAAIWSLSSLEHLFMRLRGAGSRYRSRLITLDLVSAP